MTTQREFLTASVSAARESYEDGMQRHATMKHDARALEDKIATLKSSPDTSVDDLAKLLNKLDAMRLMLPEAQGIVERRWQDLQAAQQSLDYLASQLVAKQNRAQALRREVVGLQQAADEARHQAAMREQLRDYRAGELAQLEKEIEAMG